MKKIAIIGFGNMGRAFHEGLNNLGTIGEIVICEKEDNPNLLLRDVDVVIMAIKPQQLAAFAQELEIKMTDKLVISMLAGVDTERLKADLGCQKVVRMMPNLPVKVSSGVTGWHASEQVTDQEREFVVKMLEQMGTAMELDEEAQMNALTAVSGSGPAYFYYLAEQMALAAEGLGFNAEDADQLAKQTLVGAAKLIAEEERSLAELRQAVASKGGTTEAAINKMEAGGFAGIVEAAITAAKERADEL